ncbi:hypothetical protein HHI36_012664 [Cryptolaemus montrouzieri]|uniref:G-protein coupled receptors family 3 profile domain-containing protein n=1 Tax=Cryptolaemus montrouzieri TaxID=559131 RepID=A0ABD2NF69_9CUCU
MTAVFLLGLDGRFVSPITYPTVCQAKTWLLTIGFTLSFGAMFSKVWRVHRLTTKAKSDPKVRMKKVQPWKLYSMVSGLLVIDFVIMIAWQLQDPLQRRVELFPLEDPEDAMDDSKIRPELEHCESRNNNVWLAVVCAYKGLVLIELPHKINGYSTQHPNTTCFPSNRNKVTFGYLFNVRASHASSI